mmetsp:Transcript_16041/g.27048  ORF Transcript_16041/g.27048 Transcript_16041/m.27048 type:complete len:118 (+) Transcript_16041:261-614(+)
MYDGGQSCKLNQEFAFCFRQTFSCVFLTKIVVSLLYVSAMQIYSQSQKKNFADPLYLDRLQWIIIGCLVLIILFFLYDVCIWTLLSQWISKINNFRPKARLAAGYEVDEYGIKKMFT